MKDPPVSQATRPLTSHSNRTSSPDASLHEQEGSLDKTNPDRQEATVSEGGDPHPSLRDNP